MENPLAQIDKRDMWKGTSLYSASIQSLKSFVFPDNNHV